MRFEFKTSRRAQDAVDRLYEAGYDAALAQQRVGARFVIRVDASGETAEQQVAEIVASVDSSSTRL